MLSERQKKILSILIQSYSGDTLVTGSIIASRLDVTAKTIQHDIKIINEELSAFNAQIKTISGKGYRLLANKDMLIKIIELSSNKTNNIFENTIERIKYIIGYLLFSKSPILSCNISDKVFISRSQLSNDVKKIKDILSKYNLKLISKSKQGIYIDGKEIDKRRCLIKEGIECRAFIKSGIDNIDRTKLSKIILDALSDEKYKISDFDIQNFVLYVEMTFIRIYIGEVLDEYCDYLVEFPNSHEYRISQNIFSSLSKQCLIQYNDYEISNLSSIIKAIRIQLNDNYIDKKSELFTEELFKILKTTFNIDFSDDIELRLNLVMHFTSLLVRAKNKYLADNTLTEEIKNSLTLPYDIASITAYNFEKYFNTKLSEGEIGYIAIYFALALNRLHIKNNKKHVLLITSSRKSEALLLRHEFLSHFENKISSLDVIQISDLSKINSANYDCVFATTYPGLVDSIRFNTIHINYFLSDKDLAIIDNELNQKSALILSKYFDKDLFFHNVKARDKFELIKFLCNKINEKYEYDKKYDADLYKTIIDRENAASTVFSKSVALPHPEMPFADETVVATVILDKPINWDGNEIYIVFLLNIKKRGEKEMDALFGFFSDFISITSMQLKLRNTPNYNTLLELLSSAKQKSNYNI